MKKLTTFLLIFLFVLTLQGQKALTYQGDVSLMDAGKGAFDVGTESWGAYGTNTIENDAGALKITWVDAGNGVYAYLSASNDLNADLVIGKTYRIRFRAKATGSVSLYIVGPGIFVAVVNTTTFTWYTDIFVATSTIGNYIFCAGTMSAGEVLWIDEWSIQEWYPDGRVIMYDGKVLRQD